MRKEVKGASFSAEAGLTHASTSRKQQVSLDSPSLTRVPFPSLVEHRE